MIPCHIAVYLFMSVFYPCQVLLIRRFCFLKWGRSLNWLLKNIKALVFQSNEHCDIHYYILTICDLLSFLFCLLMTAGIRAYVRGCQVSHLARQEIGRKGVKAQAKLTSLWTQVSLAESCPNANNRDHHHPPVGHCWVLKGWGMWEGKHGQKTKSHRMVAWEGKTISTLTMAKPSPTGIYLLPEENFRHQQLADQQSLDSTSLFSTFSSCLYTVVSLITRCYGLNVSSQNSYVEILTLNVAVLGGGACSWG